MRIKTVNGTKTSTFVIGTENFLTGVIAVRATKGTALYRKACIGKNTKKIIINTVEEIKAWAAAIGAYEAKDEKETKIVTALIKAAATALTKRTATA